VIHHLLAYADYVNLLIDNIYAINKNTETLIDASKVVGLEVNFEKTKCMSLTFHQNTGKTRNIKIAKRSSTSVSQFRYRGTTVINQNLVQEEIKRVLHFGNACYHSVQNLLYSRLISKNVKIEVVKLGL
jgi:hypothetical protein